MDVPSIITQHLVKGEDLNHHGTLYAGRAAEWFVEAGFIAAAQVLKPENIVCLRIHTLTFSHPVRKGEIASYTARIVLSGRSRLVAYVEVRARSELVVRGFITFINVDLDGKTFPHGVSIEPVSDEDKALAQEAANLP